jgi:hypothetical protein
VSVLFKRDFFDAAYSSGNMSEAELLYRKALHSCGERSAFSNLTTPCEGSFQFSSDSIPEIGADFGSRERHNNSLTPVLTTRKVNTDADNTKTIPPSKLHSALSLASSEVAGILNNLGV